MSPGAHPCYEWAMFGFLIKKTFFDMWDNLIRVVMINLGLVLLLAGLANLLRLFAESRAAFWVVAGLGVGLLFVYTGVAGVLTCMIADYEKPEFASILPALRATWVSSLLFAATNVALALLFSVALPFYGRLKSIVGPLALSFVIWIAVFWVLSLQYFFPVQARLDKKFLKILRKMAMVLLLDPLFSVALFAGALLVAMLSVPMVLLLPGAATVLLWWNVALKLRMYKYEYLEGHPGGRMSIPWDALLVEDRERVGKRTLKGMIFPWKE